MRFVTYWPGIVLLVTLGGAASAEVVVFPAPQDADVPPSTDYRVQVDGRPVFCLGTYRHGRPTVDTQRLYNRLVNPTALAIFDFTGSVEVRLTVRAGLLDDPGRAVVRPLAAGVRPTIDGDTVRFVLPRPGNYIFDPTGTGDRVLCLKTNVPETDVPDRDDPKVHYFGPGVHRTGEIRLGDGETLYLAGGAVLMGLPEALRAGKHTVLTFNGNDFVSYEGIVRVEGVKNVTIRGRGIISGHRCFAARRRTMTVYTEDADGVRYEGISIVDTTGSPMPVRHSRNVAIDAVGIIGHFANSGGVQLNGVLGASCRDCLIIAADDGCDLKASEERGPARNVIFEDNLLWTNGGVPMGIIIETQHPMENIVFRRNTVVHYTTYRDYRDGDVPRKGLICFNPGAGGPVRNVLFEDVVVENSVSERPLIFLGNSKLATRGRYKFQDLPYSTIRGVVFRNLVADNIANPDVIFDAHGPDDFSNIVFDSVVINGQPLRSARITVRGADVSNIRVIP